MEMVEKTGVCRFCGQNKLVEVPDYLTEEEINEEASRECYCQGAKDYKKAKELEAMIEMEKQSARGDIYRHFNNDYPDIEELFNVAIEPLAAHKFKKVSITTDDGVSASIKWKDGIEVERVDKITQRSKTKVHEINNAY